MRVFEVTFGFPCQTVLKGIWKTLLLDSAMEGELKNRIVMTISNGVVLARLGSRFDDSPPPAAIRIREYSRAATHFAEYDWDEYVPLVEEWLVYQITLSWEKSSTKSIFDRSIFRNKPFGVYITDDFDSLSVKEMKWVAGSRLRK